MASRLNIEKKFLTRSDRVKCVDLHPVEPWVLVALYNGNVFIWNYQTKNLVKTLEVTNLPVRTAKFIPRKNWFVTGSDDKQVRIFNYNTMEKVTSFEAHTDYIRSIAVHPTKPLILTCSDDLSIKCWDWDQNWKCLQVFEGHVHYVMQLAFNPKDTNTFASASLDKTIKVWSLGTASPNYTLEGHEKGVNAIDYYPGSDKPYLISGADDNSVKIWDYTTKSCVHTLSGHTNNVSMVAFIPDLPLIVTGSEDGWVKVWQLNTYRQVSSVNYGLDRAWSVGYRKGSTDLALGFEEGTAVLSLGRDDPVASMDSVGRVIWAKHNEIQSANVKASTGKFLKDLKLNPILDEAQTDGERVVLPIKDLGNCEVYPQSLQHSPNGRFVAVCGDGEYIIYTALAWRNKEFGKGTEFAWAADSNQYAVRSSSGTIQQFKNFKAAKDPIDISKFAGTTAEQIFGGQLLAVRSSQDALLLFDWESGILVRKIEVAPKQVLWSETGEFLAIICDENFYILQFNRSAFIEYVDANGDTGPEGVEEAFDVVTDIAESIVTGKWVGDCFLYTSTLNRLNYLVGNEVNTVAHLDRPIYLLGYIPRDSRVYLIDREFSVVSYALSLTVLEYQTLILRGEIEAAQALLPSIPEAHKSKLAQFLDNQGHRDLALQVSDDPEQKFDLAIAVDDLTTAASLAQTLDVPAKWRLVADKALQAWDLELAQLCLEKAQDLSGLLMLHTSTNDLDQLKKLATTAIQALQPNIALLCYLHVADLENIQKLLLATNREPEAALFARAYTPSQVNPTLQAWKSKLLANNLPKRADTLADPTSYPNLFPEFEKALQFERNPELRTDDLSQSGSTPKLVLVDNETELTSTGPATVDTNLDEVPDSNMSETTSMISMEVNTTGTDSVRGDQEVNETLLPTSPTQ